MSRDIPDHELKHRVLKLSDPYTQPNFALQIPPGARLVTISNTYTYELWPKQKVYCAKCGGRRHKHGFSAELSTGEVVPLGSSCGAEVFGESWSAAEGRFEELRKRQHELLRLDSLAPLLRRLRDGLARWELRVQSLQRRRDAFVSATAELGSRVVEAARVHDGALTVLRTTGIRVRGTGGGNVAEAVQVTVGRLPGHTLFKVLFPLELVIQALARLTKVEEMVDNTEPFDTVPMSRRRMNLERSFSDLEAVAQAYAGGMRFFTPAAFDAVARWTQRDQVTPEPYVFEDGMISDNSGRPLVRLSASPLAELDPQVLEAVRAYRSSDPGAGQSKRPKSAPNPGAALQSTAIPT
jgi:hypothetical protein